MVREKISSGSPFENIIGFSRAVRAGNFLSVAGTAPLAKDGSTVCPGDLYGQTRRCLEITKDAIERAGGQLKDVVRTRIMLKDVTEWKKAAAAHGEFFSTIKPACTFVQIAQLIDPAWLVETEVDCVIDEP